MGRSVDLNVSTISNSPYGHEETTISENHSNSALVAISDLVSSPAKNGCGTSSITSTTTRSSDSTGKSIQQRRLIPSTRMEVVAQHLQATDFKKKLLLSLSHQEEPPLTGSTTVDLYFLAGQRTMDLIRSIPLPLN
jgi:hypothetical protein